MKALHLRRVNSGGLSSYKMMEGGQITKIFLLVGHKTKRNLSFCHCMFLLVPVSGSVC